MGPFKWAIDFLVPDGSLVLAAAYGRVVELKEDSTEWGDGPQFRDKLNYVTIQHQGGEFSQYCHLAKDSVRENAVMLGNEVYQMQPIGKTAKPGGRFESISTLSSIDYFRSLLTHLSSKALR